MKVKIGDIIYAIEFQEMHNNEIGEIVRSDAKIGIQKNMPEQVQRSVLSHEIAHGMIWSYEDEHMVELLAVQLLSFIRAKENKAVIEFLQKQTYSGSTS
jgi:hypothetical protein